MINSNNQIKIGAVISYLGVLFGIVTGLIYNPWMIKTIGDSDYGLYTLAMSLINTFLFDFGLSMATERFVSLYLAKNDQTAVDNIIGLIFKIYLVITVVLVVVFVGLYFLLEKIYIQLTAAELERFKVIYIIAATYSVITFPFVTLNGILSSYEKFISLKICDLLHKVLTVALIAIALLMGQGVYLLVFVNLVVSILITAIRLLIIRTTTPVKVNLRYHDRTLVKSIFSMSLWTSISSMAMRLLLTIGPSILGIVSGSVEIAIFGYAVSIEGYVYTFVNAINGFFMPKLSRISTEQDENGADEVLDLMIKVGRFIMLLFGLIFTGFIILGQEFISLLLGEQYANSYYCVILICAYGVIAYPQQIANTYTLVRNKVRKKAIISLVSMTLYVVCAFLLGKALGAVGVSIAICISLFTQTILMNVVYYKDLKINVLKFFKNCQLKMLPGYVVYALICFFISKIPVHGWVGFLIKVISMCVLYVFVSWVLILTKSEKLYLINRIKRKEEK